MVALAKSPKNFRPQPPRAAATPFPNAPAGQAPARDSYPGKGEMMERRLAAKIPMSLYTINIKSGEVKTFHPATDWLNHVQFSPTDPTLMMFCHEGPWHKVDRIWTIRTDGSELKKIHTRTMDMEIAGHEFFCPDGNYILYDLQTPKYEVFWLAAIRHQVGQADKTLPSKTRMVRALQYLAGRQTLLRRRRRPEQRRTRRQRPMDLSVQIRKRKTKKRTLVNLAKHDYSLEPNGTFTPDGKWIVFRSNYGAHACLRGRGKEIELVFVPFRVFSWFPFPKKRYEIGTK